MTRSLLLVIVALLTTACAWNPRLPGDLVLKLDAEAEWQDWQIEAFTDAAAQWAPAFPNAIRVELVAAGANVVVLPESDDTWTGNTADMIARQTGTNRADGCGIKIKADRFASDDRAQFARLVTHEMGHCLGHTAHSDDEGSIMFWAPEVQGPTSADMAAVKGIYE